jgi:hypothetical protein
MFRKYLIFIALISILIYGCESETPDEVLVEPDLGFEGISEQHCTESGGSWNTCGSPCAGTDAEFCIQVCQLQCECGGIAGFNCPSGFKCRLSGKIADEMGVCVKDMI